MESGLESICVVGRLNQAWRYQEGHPPRTPAACEFVSCTSVHFQKRGTMRINLAMFRISGSVRCPTRPRYS
jgi:hypothetical protein